MADASARKRQKGLQGQPIDVSVKSQDTSAVPPALALFSSAQPPSKTPYSLYSKTGAAPNLDKRDPTALAGETDDIEFESRNHLGEEGDGGENEGYAVQYMIGVHNPRTKQLTLHAAPLHAFTPSIKSLKSATSNLTPAQLFTQQKANLGSAFGTRKAIQQLRSQERNKLHDTSFGTGVQAAGLSSHFQASITAASASLPSAEAIESAANEKRPIPPFDITAKSPNDVYDMNAVVSPAEMNAIDLSSFISAPGFKERNTLLPYRRSLFVASKMRQILPARANVEGQVPDPSKKDRERLKLVIHLSYLFAFKQAARGGPAGVDRQKVVEKLGRPSNAVLDALLEKYTEKSRAPNGEEIRKVTSVTELKLLAYMLVIVLKVDGWSTDIAGIADDLGMGSKKVSELFRSLGCISTAPSAADREKMVATGQAASASEAAKSKKAVLKVPLQFPKERKSKAKR
ncbi:hypothetical protein JCM11641_003633 [Rhodosporidiobolus odoratus]